MSTHTCPNCNNEFTKEFCNNCGQKVVHRITMPHLWHDLIHAFTHTDKGFFYLMGQLFKRPGEVAKNYIIEGKRKRYFMPLQYLIIISAVTTFIIASSHFMENAIVSMTEMTDSNPVLSPKKTEFINKVSAFQNKYFNIIMLLQLPFFALGSFWIYKKKKLNYAEHLTLQTFVNGQTTLLALFSMLFMTIIKLDIIKMAIVSVVISAIYQTITFTGFYQERNFIGVVKSLTSYFIGLCLYFILYTSIIVLIMILFYA